MEPICLFPVSGIILRTCFRLFADSDVAFVFLADKLARFCHHIGKALPMWWQNLANLSARKTKATSLSAKRRKHVLNIIPLTGKRQIGSINGQKF